MRIPPYLSYVLNRYSCAFLLAIFTLFNSHELLAQFDTEYYMPPVWDTGLSRRNSPTYLVISTSYPSSEFTIQTSDGTTLNYTGTVTQGSPVTYNLTPSLGMTNAFNTEELSKGLIITSTNPIQVIHANNSSENKTYTTLKGTSALGQDFYAASQTKVIATQYGTGDVHFMSVMAIEDDTDITIQMPGTKVLEGAGNLVNITLDRYETYLVKTAAGDNITNNITGAHITSNKDIAVLSGGQHLRQSGAGGAGDGGIDQLVPVPILDTEYVLSRGNTGLDYVILVATENDTDIFTDGGATATTLANAGDYYEFDLSGAVGTPHYVLADKPVYAYHVSGYSNNEMGMSIVPSILCRGSKVIDFLEFPGAVNSVTVILENSGIPDFTFNGESIADLGVTTTTVPGRSDWSTFAIPDNKVLNSNTAFSSNSFYHLGLLVGSGSAGTFGFLSGFEQVVTALDPSELLPTKAYTVEATCDLRGATATFPLTLDAACGTTSITSATTLEATSSVVYSNTGVNTFDLDYSTAASSTYITDVITVTFQSEIGGIVQATGEAEITVVIPPNIDEDQDTVPDCADPDDDNDGILDINEYVGSNDPFGDEDGDLIQNFLDISDDSDLGDGSLTDYTDSNGDGVPDVYDFDGDGIPNHLDLDSDGDGIPDNVEAQPSDSASYLQPGGIDGNTDGIDDSYPTGITPENTDPTDTPDFLNTDADNDGVLDTIEAFDFDNDGVSDITPIGDSDMDGLDDAFDSSIGDYTGANGNQVTNDPANELNNTDGLDQPNYRDTDDDNDGVTTDLETGTSPLDPSECGDSDADGCDDCSATAATDFSAGSNVDTANDGPDLDGDGICDAGDTDDDNDGVSDADEATNGTDPNDPSECGDSDADGCDDCSATAATDFSAGSNVDPANDGPDNDGDGICDAGDTDDDNDGVSDIDEATNGTDPNDPSECGDSDADGCDDCSATAATDFSAGSNADPANDGPDNDGDGICDAGDTDDDNDGVSDTDEATNGTDPNDPSECGDNDADGCDDCSATAATDFSAGSNIDPANDGPDNDGDGICDAGDTDDDNDGVSDTDEATNGTDPNDPSECGDSDADGCDDCSATAATDFSAGSNVDTANDGLDFDGDGICDAGDTDDDNDGVSDTDEITNGTDPNDPSECGDSDADGCDDCSATAATDFSTGSNVDPANDGPDSDGDGICNTSDTDDDNDGNPDTTDPNPLAPITRDDALSIVENTTGSVDILLNDDFLPGSDTSIQDLGTGTATGTVLFDSDTGIMQYTPAVGEEGTAVTVVYRVCNTAVSPNICENATVTITVQTDTDDDGIPDVTDTDDDNDGNPDTSDPNPLIPITENDVLTVSEGTTGIINILSNDDFLPGPNSTIIDTGAGTASGTVTFDNLTGDMSYMPSADEAGQTVIVEYQVCNIGVSPAVCETALVTILVINDDTDGDGIPNSIDLDDDNDGIPDTVELGDNPTLDTDNDGIIDSLDLDADGDGVPDVIESGNQGVDTNNDGQLDGPFGSDGIADILQNVPDDGVINYTPADTDGDGINDYQDIDDDGDGVNTVHEDINNNGDPVDDDTDNDGIPDYLDTDDDGDGVFTANENPNPDMDGDPFTGETQDTDNDGIPDYLDMDDDGDGIFTAEEDINDDDDPTNDDSDGDGIPNYLDPDDDGDGINTLDESTGTNGDTMDADGDGIPDYLDPNSSDTTSDDDLEVFNVITPNGDGDHDVLIIRNIENFPSNELQIFNRWGVIVYKTLGYGINGEYFRGESKGRATISKDEMLPVGTYFYILTYKTDTGETKQRSDYLYINR